MARRWRRAAAGVTHLFPTPEVLATADLTGIGLTGARAKTLNALAAAVRDGQVDFDRMPKELRAALVARARASAPGPRSTSPCAASRIRTRFPAGDLVLQRMAGRLTERRRSPTQGNLLSGRTSGLATLGALYAVLHLWRACPAHDRDA